MKPLKFYLLTIKTREDLISEINPLPICRISETGIQISMENNDLIEIPFHAIAKVRFVPYFWFTMYRMFVKIVVDDHENGQIEYRLEPANPILPNSKGSANLVETVRFYRALRDLKAGQSVDVVENPYLRNKRGIPFFKEIDEGDYKLDPHSFYDKNLKRKHILGIVIPLIISVVLILIGLIGNLK